MTSPRFGTADIRRYYDRHTPAFLRFGQGGGAGAIHRAVWGPGVRTRLEAFHFVDDQQCLRRGWVGYDFTVFRRA